MKVFPGSSNISLAKKVAKLVGVDLAQVELDRFAGDEVRVWVREEKIGKEAVVIQSISRPTDHHLVEFCLLCDGLRRKGVKEITAVIPWLGYSKQDKVFRPGEPLSVKAIAKIIQTVPLERIITFDLHNLAILGFFDVPVVNLSAGRLFVDYFSQEKHDRVMVVAPDAGAVKASTAFAQSLNAPVAYIDKKRDLVTGQVHIYDINRSVEGFEVLIVDDMIATGSTLIETAKFLKEHGAIKVRVAATHYWGIEGVNARLEESQIDEIVVSDTIQVKDKLAKLKVLSVAQLITNELVETWTSS